MKNKGCAKGRHGFTFFEILIVMSLIAIISLAGVMAYGQVKKREELGSVVVKIVQILSKTRGKSVSGENDKTWKVVILEDRVELKDNDETKVEEYRLPKEYSLSGALGEMVFKRGDGRVVGCETTCLFTVSEVGGSLTHQFGVLFSGAVEY